MENLDETSSSENFSEVDEEESYMLIGEPPWRGKDELDDLIYLTFNACEVIFVFVLANSLLITLFRQKGTAILHGKYICLTFSINTSVYKILILLMIS